MRFSEVLAWQRPGQTEAQFQSQVLRYAALRGWHVYHTLRSEKSPAGFPDLVLVRRPRVIFAELKSDRGRCTPEQRAWLAELAECSVEVKLWRPSDWEAIEGCLR